jgi:hypothetical protein
MALTAQAECTSSYCYIQSMTVTHSMNAATEVLRYMHRPDAGPEYVPLLKRSYALFQQLEGEVGQQLLKKTGNACTPDL